MVMNKSFTMFHLSLLGLTFEFRILVVFVCLHPTTQKANSENSVPIGVKLEKQSKTNPKDLGGSAARWCLSRPKYEVNGHNLSETPLHNTHQYKRATSLAGIYSKEIIGHVHQGEAQGARAFQQETLKNQMLIIKDWLSKAKLYALQL